MLEQETLWDTTSAIGSPGSEGGRSPCDSQDGQMTGQCGQALHHASRLATPDDAEGTTTSDTLRQPGLTSSASVALNTLSGSK